MASDNKGKGGKGDTLKALQQELKTTRARLNDREKTIKSLEQDKKNMKSTIDSLESWKKKINAKMAKEQKIGTVAKDDTGTQLEKMRERISELEENKENNLHEIDELKKLAEKLGGEIENLTKELESRVSSLSELEKGMEIKNNELLEKDSRMGSLEERVKELGNILGGKNDWMAKLDKENGALLSACVAWLPGHENEYGKKGGLMENSYDSRMDELRKIVSKFSIYESMNMDEPYRYKHTGYRNTKAAKRAYVVGSHSKTNLEIALTESVLVNGMPTVITVDESTLQKLAPNECETDKKKIDNLDSCKEKLIKFEYENDIHEGYPILYYSKSQQYAIREKQFVRTRYWDIEKIQLVE